MQGALLTPGKSGSIRLATYTCFISSLQPGKTSRDLWCAINSTMGAETHTANVTLERNAGEQYARFIAVQDIEEGAEVLWPLVLHYSPPYQGCSLAVIFFSQVPDCVFFCGILRFMFRLYKFLQGSNEPKTHSLISSPEVLPTHSASARERQQNQHTER